MEDKKFWDEYAKKRRGPTHPVVEVFVKEKIELISRIVNLKGKSLIDIGCGNGRFIYHFLPLVKDVVGVDYSLSMTVEARKYTNCQSLVGDGLSLPFKDDTFDISFGGCYLHNLSDPVGALKEMKRVSKEYVILVEPSPFNPLIFLFDVISSEEELSALKFTKKYITSLFLKVGLEVVHVSTQGFVFPNRTPMRLLPILKRTRFMNKLGAYIIVIGKSD